VKQGTEIVGYIWDVKRGGIESVTCHVRDDGEWDIYVELVLDPMNGGFPADDRGGNATLALHHEPARRGLVDAKLTGQVSWSLGES